jgi:NAD(P)-dependent dehydrogenase (short-subunit alcohol dehydrogenase family)
MSGRAGALTMAGKNVLITGANGRIGVCARRAWRESDHGVSR